MKIGPKEEIALSNEFLWGRGGEDGQAGHRKVGSTEIAEAWGIQFVDTVKEWRESALPNPQLRPGDSLVTVAMYAAPKFGAFGS